MVGCCVLAVAREKKRATDKSVAAARFSHTRYDTTETYQVSGCIISFLYKPALYNPRPLQCLYKPEGLVRIGEHKHIG